MKTQRRIQIQNAAQRGRTRKHQAFGLRHRRFTKGELGRCTIRVGRFAFTLLGVNLVEASDLAGLVTSLKRQSAAAFGSRELGVSKSDSQEHLILDGDRRKRLLRDDLPAHQKAVNALRYVALQNNAGILTVPAAIALAPAPT